MIAMTKNNLKVDLTIEKAKNKAFPIFTFPNMKFLLWGMNGQHHNNS